MADTRTIRDSDPSDVMIQNGYLLVADYEINQYHEEGEVAAAGEDEQAWVGCRVAYHPGDIVGTLDIGGYHTHLVNADSVLVWIVPHEDDPPDSLAEYPAPLNPVSFAELSVHDFFIWPGVVGWQKDLTEIDQSFVRRKTDGSGHARVLDGSLTADATKTELVYRVKSDYEFDMSRSLTFADLPVGECFIRRDMYCADSGDYLLVRCKTSATDSIRLHDGLRGAFHGGFLVYPVRVNFSLA